MNTTHDLERDLGRWMEEVAPRRAPQDLASIVVERTRSMRPRPGWLARLMEPPMNTTLLFGRGRIAGQPASLILLALLLLALIVGVVAVGSQLLRRPTLPPPFGVAGNGLMAANVGGQILVMQPDGAGVRPLDLPFTGLTGISFSRDGTKLAAWSTPDQGSQAELSLIVANVDGSGAFEVEPGTGISRPDGTVGRIEWSPEDRRLAFSDGADTLYVADIDERRIRAIGTPDKARRDPAWSPDGRLAYRCELSDGSLHLCVMDADGTREQVLETSPGTLWAFQGSSWSPDGKHIAYTVDDGSGYDVATIDVDTGQERILTGQTAVHTIFPLWTPDGEHVVFASGIVRADGSGLRIYEDGGCSSMEPSPDGRFVACLTEDRLLLWPVDGGEPTTIRLEGAGDGDDVSWQRVGG